MSNLIHLNELNKQSRKPEEPTPHYRIKPLSSATEERASKAGRRAETIRSIRVTGNAYKVKKRIFFNRDELSQMMGLYSQMVAKGIWRDYSVDHLQGQALFSVFKHAHEAPVLMISKQAQASGKGREYVVYNGIKRLKRSEKLTDVLTTIRSRSDILK